MKAGSLTGRRPPGPAPTRDSSTDERSALDVPEAELHADLVEAAEVFGRDVAIERDVAVGRAQVLAEGEDVDVDGAEILHDLDDLLVRLAHAEDDARLGRDVRREALGRA